MKPTLLTQRETAQARLGQQIAPHDERVYVSLHQLVRLQHRATGLSFLPRQLVHSLLSGRHASRIRGRGLNFEEIRAYHSGDDIRTIDWKVTARTRSPHTRVFTEERDRAALLIVDQRIGMFFGTRVNTKSVTAAQTAALAAWRVLDVGDRVGAIIFNDSEIKELRPHRSRQTVMQILRTITDFNNALRADLDVSPNPGMLHQVLDRACRSAKHDFLVAIISDFHGLDEKTNKHLLKLTQSNDVVAGLIHDPSASELASSQGFVVTDGELQVELSMRTGRTRQRLEDVSKKRIAEVLSLQRRLQMPVLPISTAEDVVIQLQRLLGRAHRVQGAAP